MGLMLLRKISILFLLISSSFLSTSFAGRQSKFGNKSAKEVSATYEDVSRKPSHHMMEAADIHERLLRVNTKDYGRYDPAPALVKPPFKLIPN
ncbi:hypothetical protein L1049_015040 [Liquidambar formosana]|uniref:Uncharacterized protein n=1 Tax=Liquidambar formosana TaxID=63359 RepID=A0AAP0S472_LIQFO